MIIPADVLRPLPVWQLVGVLVLVYIANGFLQSRRKATRETPLASPPRPSWLFGAHQGLMNNPDIAAIYEAWIEEYGSVFRIPAAFGSNRVILADPKAIAHFYSEETWTYVQTRLSRVAIEGLVRHDLFLPFVDAG